MVDMRPESAIGLEIAALAGRQHGVVARWQLRELGLSDRAISHAAGSGRLHRLFQGVFAVGHTVLRLEGHWMAAVLAGGDQAVLSHQDAAAAWDLRPVGAGAIHVTVPGHAGRKRRAGVRIHRRVIAADETTSHRGIPITTPARTLIDLATTLNGRPLEQALDRAEQLRLVDFADLASRVQPGRPGSPSLQAVLSRYDAGSTPTRSELEERFLALCDRHGLPRPKVNVRIEGFEVDFVWRDARLIVEVDGYAYHRSPSAFEADRERDVNLEAAGWTVLRFTWAQITRRPKWVAASIRQRMARLPR
jgi:very-short-patch-repair endonuclease